jgi:hypothetical protein
MVFYHYYNKIIRVLNRNDVNWTLEDNIIIVKDCIPIKLCVWLLDYERFVHIKFVRYDIPRDKIIKASKLQNLLLISNLCETVSIVGITLDKCVLEWDLPTIPKTIVFTNVTIKTKNVYSYTDLCYHIDSKYDSEADHGEEDDGSGVEKKNNKTHGDIIKIHNVYSETRVKVNLIKFVSTI